MSEQEECLILRTQDARGVVRLTLNRPQAFNALSEAMLAQLQREFDAIASDESVRVVIIAAEGKAFCAGHDLKEMRADPSLEYYERLFAQCSRRDAHNPAIAGACDCARAGNRDCRWLSVGRDVRSRSRVEHLSLRSERGKCRPFLFHTWRGTFTKCFA